MQYLNNSSATRPQPRSCRGERAPSTARAPDSVGEFSPGMSDNSRGIMLIATAQSENTAMPALPEELMQRLHEANQHFQQAKEKLDGVEFHTPESRWPPAPPGVQFELDDVTREIDQVPTKGPSCLVPVNHRLTDAR